jgi:hypothetical protein
MLTLAPSQFLIMKNIHEKARPPVSTVLAPLSGSSAGRISADEQTRWGPLTCLTFAFPDTLEVGKDRPQKGDANMSLAEAIRKKDQQKLTKYRENFTMRLDDDIRYFYSRGETRRRSLKELTVKFAKASYHRDRLRCRLTPKDLKKLIYSRVLKFTKSTKV